MFFNDLLNTCRILPPEATTVYGQTHLQTILLFMARCTTNCTVVMARHTNCRRCKIPYIFKESLNIYQTTALTSPIWRAIPSSLPLGYLDEWLILPKIDVFWISYSSSHTILYHICQPTALTSPIWRAIHSPLPLGFWGELLILP